METDETQTPDEQPARDQDRWELWAKLAVGLAALMVLAWVLVAAKLGTLSVQIHAMLIPTLAVATLPFMALGLIRALLRPPAIRRSRVIGFTLLIATAYVGKEPMIAPPLATADWTTDVPHRLPFDGEWLTISGGDDASRNAKATTAAFRWAYDFTKLEDGARHTLDGKNLEDWACWGEAVLAPAPGKVVVAIDNILDNPPGELVSNSVFGNHVVLKVAGDEYLYLAHLQRGSLAVEAGDEVAAGAPLGKCGNSGRTIEPHLHVHAQDRLGFPIAQGLPLRFDAFFADGKRVEDAMPVGGTGWSTNDGWRVAPAP